MMAHYEVRLQKAFDECVTAYLERRRSIEDSLYLYPAFADELAPLLRTASWLSDSFQKVTPPARVQERGLQRFLADARARRLRELTAVGHEQHGLTSFGGQHRPASAQSRQPHGRAGHRLRLSRDVGGGRPT